jgi:hypothetical protein
MSYHSGACCLILEPWSLVLEQSRAVNAHFRAPRRVGLLFQSRGGSVEAEAHSGGVEAQPEEAEAQVRATSCSPWSYKAQSGSGKLTQE